MNMFNGNGFGAQATQAQGGGLFGAKPGQTGLFGGQAAPAQPTQGGGLFGAQATQGGGMIGQQAAQPQPAQGTGLFGGQAAQAQPAQGPGLFGGQAAQAQPAQGAGLFGGQTGQTGLFGGQAVPTQPAQGGGLFGAQATPTQPAGGLFGQNPAQGGLFGGQTTTLQAQGGLFNGQPAQQNTGGAGGLFQNQGATGLFNQGQGQNQPIQTNLPFGQPNQNQGAGFVNFPQQQQPAQQQQGMVFMTLLEAQQKAFPLQILNADIFCVSLNNTYRRRTLYSFPDQSICGPAFEVETQLTKQTQDLSNLQSTLQDLSTGSAALQEEIIKASTDLAQYNNEQLSLRQNIIHLENQLQGLVGHQHEMQSILMKFNQGEIINAPFKFYIEMQKNQEVIIEKLAQKVDQASTLAAKILSSKSQSEKKSFTENQSLKERVFSICKMLYTQQKQAAANLHQIEKAVIEAREKFSQVIQSQRQFVSQSDIDELFKMRQNVQVNQVLADINKQKTETTLSQVFDQSLQIFGNEKKAEQVPPKDNESNKKLSLLVARPFKKFQNYSQYEHPQINQNDRADEAMRKRDLKGQLGIGFQKALANYSTLQLSRSSDMPQKNLYVTPNFKQLDLKRSQQTLSSFSLGSSSRWNANQALTYSQKHSNPLF